MLTENQISEIREHLEKAQNPLFYYDNDTDGFCSFVILRKFLGRGKGVAVRSFPDLDASYARKAQELNADYVFVLDKPVLSREFVEEIKALQIPLVWIDHHNVSDEDFSDVYELCYSYNPSKNLGDEKSEEPVTYLSYKISGRKEEMWLAIMGCIADHYLPDFADEFGERYPDYWKKVNEPFEGYFNTEIGMLAKAINFGLKDSTTHIVELQNFMISCQSPEDVLFESQSNYNFRMKYSSIKKKYDLLLERAKGCAERKILFFEYSGDLSISSDLSNELSYLFPDKYIVVGYKKGAAVNLSLRGKGVKKFLEEILREFPDATGGGHDDAVGSRILASDLPKFKELLGGLIG